MKTNKKPVPVPPDISTAPDPDPAYLESLAGIMEANNIRADRITEPEPKAVEFPDIAKDYFLYGDRYIKAVCSRSEFSIMKTRENIIKRETGLSKEALEMFLTYIARSKQLSNYRVLRRTDINSDTVHYTYDPNAATFTVYYPAIAAKIQDNDLIENYLAATFGEYKDFIKKYIALYCYTDYRKTPTICLTGERGTGKNTFAEGIIGSIYPELSITNPDLSGAFNTYAESKAVIIDESSENAKEQYLTLKKLSGQTWLNINPKGLPHHTTRNNLNLLILSNEVHFIYVRSDELPKDESNNQFFIFRMKPVSTLDSGLQDKLKDRLGHYIRTELKQVFESLELELSKYRYGIPVPITPEARFLFATSKTETEQITDRIIERLLEIYEAGGDYNTAINEGFIPTAEIDKQFKDVKDQIGARHSNYTAVKKLLQTRDFITANARQKRNTWGIKNERLYCYEIGTEGKKMFQAIREKQAAINDTQERTISPDELPF